MCGRIQYAHACQLNNFEFKSENKHERVELGDTCGFKWFKK